MQRGNKRPWQSRNRENTRDTDNTREAKLSTTSKGDHQRFDNDQNGSGKADASEEPKAKQVKVEVKVE